MQLGESILRYSFGNFKIDVRRLTGSNSEKANNYLNELGISVECEVGDKINSLPTSAKAWLESPPDLYFLPDMGIVLYIEIIEALNYNSNR
jgi:hypothetical protein